MGGGRDERRRSTNGQYGPAIGRRGEGTGREEGGGKQDSSRQAGPAISAQPRPPNPDQLSQPPPASSASLSSSFLGKQMQEDLLKTLKEIIPTLVQLEIKRFAPMPSTPVPRPAYQGTAQPPGWLPMPIPPPMLTQTDPSQSDWSMPASRMPVMPTMLPCRASQSQTALPQMDWPALA